MPPGLTIPSIFTAVDRFSAPLMRMRGALGAFVNRAEVGLARVERSFRRVISPLTAFQNTMRGFGIYLGLFTALLILRNAVNIMADFEQAQINIASVAEKDSIPFLRAMSSEARKVAVMYGQSAAAIAGFQFELVKMGFSAKEVLGMTEPITTGAVALRTTPERLQEVVGAILKSHDMPVIDPNTGINNAQKAVNQFAFVANATAAQFEDLATMLPIINRLTHKMNITFPQALAVLGQLRNVQIHTSTGATSLKNILLDLKANSWEDLRKGMERVMKARNQTVFAFNKFGKRSVVSAVEIASMFDFIEKLAKQTEGVEAAYTNVLAAKQLDSIRGRINLFKAAYREMILAVDDGSGPLGKALKQHLDVGAAMLLLSADSEAARTRLAMMDASVIALAKKYLIWLKVIGVVIVALIAMKAALILWNAIVVISKVVMFAWSVALGVAAAMGWANVFALRGNIVALTILRGILALVAAAQWVWNAAMVANPIGLIVIGIAALAGWIVLLVNKWNEWGAAASFTLGPLAVTLTMIMALISHWDRIVESFSNGGFISGIKAIGVAILDFMLLPLQQIYSMLGEIPGLESLTRAAQAVEAIRARLLTPGAGAETVEPTAKVLQPQAANTANAFQEIMSRLQIDINNRSGFPVSARGEGNGKLNVQSTFDDF